MTARLPTTIQWPQAKAGVAKEEANIHTGEVDPASKLDFALGCGHIARQIGNYKATIGGISHVHCIHLSGSGKPGRWHGQGFGG
jgi:hypothetical protein